MAGAYWYDEHRPLNVSRETFNLFLYFMLILLLYMV